jgi:hypothetical protein
MPRRGFGFSTGRIRPQNRILASPADNDRLRLTPSENWNGTVGSGFADVPSDPVRTTAKPVMRLLTPDYQWFTNTLTIGVQAWANDGGTLIGGIDRVRFWFEGASVDVLAPTFRTFTRFDGSTYGCIGYWATLKKPDGVSGNGHVYIEAIPADATMQKRVLGPIRYSAVDTLHDFDLAVDNNAPVVAGASYQTVPAALAYLKGRAAQNPRITIKATDTTAFHDLNSATDYAGGTGRCPIEAEAPVTFGFASYTGDVANSFRPLYGGLHIRGLNITFDCHFLTRITQEQLTTNNGIWLDRVKITNNAPDPYWRGGIRPSPMFVERQTISWFTDCFAEIINDPYSGATLARGCIARAGYNDFAQGSFCVVNCKIEDWDSKEPWQTFVDAITITGPANSTLTLSGGNETATRTFTARVNGVSVGTFAVGTGEARYNTATAPGYNPATAGQGYFIQDVAAWINSRNGWSATVIDNTRRASAFSDYRGGIGQDKGRSFTNVPVSSPTTFQTYFDVHTDLFKQTMNENVSNVIWAFNVATHVRGQSFFVTESSGTQDWAIINNAVNNVEGEGNLIQFAMRAPGGGTFSHFTFAHNTVAGQAALLRSSDPDFAPDGYCLFANNVLADLYWSAEGARGTGTIKDNVIDAGHTAPQGSTGTVIAGTAASKVPGAPLGDFTPAGELLTNLKPPVLAIDAVGRLRAEGGTVGGLRAAGAVA